MGLRAEQLKQKLAQVKSAEAKPSDPVKELEDLEEIETAVTRAGERAPVERVPGKPGRPRVQVDLDLVRKLGFIHCTEKEVAAVLHISEPTLRAFPGFLEMWEQGKQEGKKALRRAMWKNAMTGNTVMQIWLSKNEMGYKEPRFEGAFTGTMKLKVVRE